MKTCPHCGKNLRPPKSAAPYQYRGWLKKHLPLILRSFQHGIDKSVIVTLVQSEMGGQWDSDYRVSQAIRQIGLSYKFLQPQSNWPEYRRARQEHAWLLRAEKKTFREIGERLGVHAQRARDLVLQFGRRAGTATKRTRWSISQTLDS